MKSRKFIIPGTIAMIIITLILIALPASSAMAYTDGPNNPGSGTSLTGIGTETWIGPENIITPGSGGASVTLYHGHRYSWYLEGLQYGFTLPAEASITGIEVDINRYSSSRNPSIIDNVVSLVKAGTIVGDNKAIAAAI